MQQLIVWDPKVPGIAAAQIITVERLLEAVGEVFVEDADQVDREISVGVLVLWLLRVEFTGAAIADRFAHDKRNGMSHCGGIQCAEGGRLNVASVGVQRRNHRVTQIAVDLVGLRECGKRRRLLRVSEQRKDDREDDRQEARRKDGSPARQTGLRLAGRFSDRHAQLNLSWLCAEAYESGTEGWEVLPGIEHTPEEWSPSAWKWQTGFIPFQSAADAAVCEPAVYESASEVTRERAQPSLRRAWIPGRDF
jgi:hypothetical protein